MKAWMAGITLAICGVSELCLYSFCRVQERADKCFQVLTKETDRRIAKAYVVLAFDPDITDEGDCSKKGESLHKVCASLRLQRLTSTLNDDQWEDAQKLGAASHPVHTSRILLFV